MSGPNLELIEVTTELRKASLRLAEGSRQLFTLAREKAEAEGEYRRSLAIRMLALKEAGQSVTLIPDIARGECSELKFARDLAEARYQAGRDSLEAIRVQVSALQTIIRYQAEVEKGDTE